MGRLVSDTAPNLVVAERLEVDPYDDRRIRRALMTVKFTLGMAFVVILFFATATTNGAIAPVVTVVGGRGPLLLGMFAVLAVNAIAIPRVRVHRGVPIARPSAGPAAGALLFVVLAFLVPTIFPTRANVGVSDFTASWILTLAGGSALVGTLVVGTAQRIHAATRRLSATSFGLIHGDVRESPRSGPEEASRTLLESLRVAPFLFIPLLPALLRLWTSHTPLVNPLLIAGSLAVVPPLLFDARKGGRRFTVTSALTATVLLAAGLAASELRGGMVLVETGCVVLAYPLFASLFRTGRATLVAVCMLTYFLCRVGMA